MRSLHLKPEELQEHNVHLQEKFARIAQREVRFATEQIEDAELVIVAYGTAARIARTAVERGRDQGLKLGIFRPITLWPFPSAELAAAVAGKKRVLVVELSAGQMVEDVRLAINGALPVDFLGHQGGVLPAPSEVLDACRKELGQ